jgi:hypothetical protein
MSPKIQSHLLEKAAATDMDAYLTVFTNAYLETTEGTLNEKTMDKLNGWQHSLLAYHYFKEEVMQGGFIQLIQNGYGSYIFKNPFAKSLRIFGATELSKLIYKAREIYELNQKDLEQELTDDEFHALYEKYEAFEELEERFFEIETTSTEAIARYVDNHLSDFADIVQ